MRSTRGKEREDKFYGRETLFTDGDWTIMGVPADQHSWDWVWHKCPWKKNWALKQKSLSIWTMDTHTHCPHCGEEIPEGVMALWKMNNWDALQALHQAQNEVDPMVFYPV